MGILSGKSDKPTLTDAVDVLADNQPIESAPEPSPAHVIGPATEPATANVVEVVDVDSELKQHARAIRAASRTAVSSLLKAGEHLAQARDLLADHSGGTFGRWVKDECGLAKSTSYRMIAVWEAFGQLSHSGTTLAGVPATALYQLAAVPGAVSQVADLAEAGEKITEADAKRILIATRPTDASGKGAESATAKPDPVTIMVDGLGAVVVRPVAGVSARDVLVQAVRDILEREKRAAA